MNFSWSNFIVGVIGLVVGVFLIKDAFYFNHHILFLGWFEKKYGPGTGTFAYKLIGIAVIIFSTFVAIGQINLIDSAFGRSASNQSVTPQPSRSRVNRSGIAP
ncbi:MAG: hypothetical protein AAGF07_02690 [Patescibacteria group bacterium]